MISIFWALISIIISRMSQYRLGWRMPTFLIWKLVRKDICETNKNVYEMPSFETDADAINFETLKKIVIKTRNKVWWEKYSLRFHLSSVVYHVSHTAASFWPESIQLSTSKRLLQSHIILYNSLICQMFVWEVGYWVLGFNIRVTEV